MAPLTSLLTQRLFLLQSDRGDTDLVTFSLWTLGPWGQDRGIPDG